RYFVSLDHLEYSFSAVQGQQVRLKQLRLSLQAARARPRGSLEDAWREGLFAVPFGQGFLEGYRSQEFGEGRPAPAVSGSDQAPPRPHRLPWRGIGYGLLTGAAVAGATALTLNILSNDAFDQYQHALPEEKSSLRARTENLDLGATVALAVAG